MIRKFVNVASIFWKKTTSTDLVLGARRAVVGRRRDARHQTGAVGGSAKPPKSDAGGPRTKKSN